MDNLFKSIRNMVISEKTKQKSKSNKVMVSHLALSK